MTHPRTYFFSHLLLLILAASASAANPKDDPFAKDVRTTEPLTAQEELKRFHVPPGFEVQLVASEPEIGKPVNMAIDERGRIWVTQSYEYPFPAKPGSRMRDSIKILDDFAPDGHAARITTFADGLNVPMGVYPYKNGAIAYSVPYVSNYQEIDGSGKADRQDVLYGPYAYDRDTHGMTNGFRRGFDGWLYADHGFNNHTTLRGTDGQAIYMDSGHTYRMRLDGSHVEIWTHGLPNPWGSMFDERGNLFVADCSSKPLHQLLRGGYYEHFGRPDDGLGLAPGMMQHMHNSTAIAGLFMCLDDRWPAEYRNNFFVGNPVTCRIDRDSPMPHGSTILAKEEPDFLISDDPWFRPVDLQLAPDGSMYVADFYNRIIGHYEVALTHPGRDRQRGRIWRIVYKGDASTAPPPWHGELGKATADQLIALLANPNIKMRFLATDQLTDRIGAAAIDPVKGMIAKPVNTNQKVHGLWILFRLGALEAPALAEAAKDADPVLRTHAMRLFAELPQWTPEQRQIVVGATMDPDPFVKRCAADALGVHPAIENVRPLLDLVEHVPADDTHLKYVVRMALRNQIIIPETFGRLPLPEWSPEDELAIANVAMGIPSEASASFVLKYAQQIKDPKALDGAIRHIARYGAAPLVDAALKLGQSRAKEDVEVQLALFKAFSEGMAQRGSPLSETAVAWGSQTVTDALKTPEKRTNQTAKRHQAALDLARTMKLKAVEPIAMKLLIDRKENGATRVAAAKALATIDPKEAIEPLARLIADTAEPLPVREAAAQSLGIVNTSESRELIATALHLAAGQWQLKLGLALAANPEGAALLMEKIEQGQVSARLLQEPAMKFVLTASKVNDLDGRTQRLTHGLPALGEEVQKLIDQRRAAFNPAKASAAAGAQVFAKNCMACHELDAQGAHVGPPLDGVGSRGLDRLVEDVLDPSRNVDPAFRSHDITLTIGGTTSGLPRREEGDLLVFADSTGKEFKISRSQIKKDVESKMSLMPSNFNEAIPPEDFNNLMAFLMSKNAVQKQ